MNGIRKIAERSLCLALDDVQDPGNLGTIIRIADWFGIHHIFCSNGCVDAFNPKTVQATMGALARVQLHYCDLPAFLQRSRKKFLSSVRSLTERICMLRN